eukprot:gene13013-7746_t
MENGISTADIDIPIDERASEATFHSQEDQDYLKEKIKHLLNDNLATLTT